MPKKCRTSHITKKKRKKFVTPKNNKRKEGDNVSKENMSKKKKRKRRRMMSPASILAKANANKKLKEVKRPMSKGWKVVNIRNSCAIKPSANLIKQMKNFHKNFFALPFPLSFYARNIFWFMVRCFLTPSLFLNIKNIIYNK